MRELREELGVDVTVGERLGDDVPIGESMILRAYLVARTGGALHPHDHRELRWVSAAELEDLPWVPPDRRGCRSFRNALARETLTLGIAKFDLMLSMMDAPEGLARRARICDRFVRRDDGRPYGRTFQTLLAAMAASR